ncbi:unnamed protein product, partial [Mesorhabditis spiculigera]
MEIAIRMLRPETKNMDITAAIDKTAAAYGVKPIENMVSHSLERNHVDGALREGGGIVAQFKSTVMVMPNGLVKITGLPLDVDTLALTCKLEDEALLKTLNSALKPKKKEAPAEEGRRCARRRVK